MLDELEEWNLIMAHYFGLLSVTFKEEAQQQPHFKDLVEKVRLK